jgi:hypothetical protein
MAGLPGEYKVGGLGPRPYRFNPGRDFSACWACERRSRACGNALQIRVNGYHGAYARSRHDYRVFTLPHGSQAPLRYRFSMLFQYIQLQ